MTSVCTSQLYSIIYRCESIRDHNCWRNLISGVMRSYKVPLTPVSPAGKHSKLPFHWSDFPQSSSQFVTDEGPAYLGISSTNRNCTTLIIFSRLSSICEIPTSASWGWKVTSRATHLYNSLQLVFYAFSCHLKWTSYKQISHLKQIMETLFIWWAC